ncbi:cytochrome b/b6 domain-containing protein [Hyphomicrobium facile]|uniref:Thiosulfate reductase cytochrome b subunit n=1 Tax=Hyphomicrobium facile TaxID=51670 RepID=A0A1I7NTZ3_9HYPH|nr:cytochrome b/b6 domain-containing protein [Hyphomicrobium facile]SFV38136.1 Thiosulfate reductase cytochrome b subunit [Hyphomicrobium facile]
MSIAHESAASQGPLIYRQALITRLTHWTWAVCLFFLLLSGLQIFNAHPTLYIGNQSGFGFDNAVLSMRAVDTPHGAEGRTTILGHEFNTTGVFGVSGSADDPSYRGIPAALTIPSYRDLATGRVVHFFFAWLLVATLIIWLTASFANGHLRRDLTPTRRDLENFPSDVRDHVRFRFHHGNSYNVLQKLSYCAVLFVLFPLIIATGLTMSPGIDAGFPWLVEVFGGRQTARTLHFLAMFLLVLFFVVHVMMVLLAGPFNELRSMITGWYRTSPDKNASEEEKP